MNTDVVTIIDYSILVLLLLAFGCFLALLAWELAGWLDRNMD